mmetsp:Transcript_75995/g.180811  ORF Transcript_75995/g.180811 Transcript_75995/m.180811 type:complete len:247 (+) Transcript_75995:183-923(+)
MLQGLNPSVHHDVTGIQRALSMESHRSRPCSLRWRGTTTTRTQSLGVAWWDHRHRHLLLRHGWLHARRRRCKCQVPSSRGMRGKVGLLLPLLLVVHIRAVQGYELIRAHLWHLSISVLFEKASHAHQELLASDCGGDAPMEGCCHRASGLTRLLNICRCLIVLAPRDHDHLCWGNCCLMSAIFALRELTGASIGGKSDLVPQVQCRPAMAAIQDDPHANALRQRLHQDTVELIISDLARRLKVAWN